MINYQEFSEIYEETLSVDIATIDSKISTEVTKRKNVYTFLKNKKKLKKDKTKL